MIRKHLFAVLIAITLAACQATPPVPQTLDEGVDVQWGFISVLTSANYSRYYTCRENAADNVERQFCIDEARDSHSVLRDAESSLDAVEAIEDLDEGKLDALRVLRAALRPHLIPGDRAQLEVLDQ